jgi:tRNA (guanine-N7-)-methyltransferase
MNIDYQKYPLPKRLRHHTAANLYIPLSELRERPGYYPPLNDKLDWRQLFADGKAPTAIDVGCGKGAFLFESADNHEDTNFLGIEIRKPLVEWLNMICREYRLQNCAAIWHCVANGMPFLADGSVKEVYYLFPDPWPKQKHVKRRVFNDAFLDEISRVLASDGKLFIATDVDEIHDYHTKVLAKRSDFFFEVLSNRWDLPVTNKEKFCLANNIEVYMIVCYKVAIATF